MSKSLRIARVDANLSTLRPILPQTDELIQSIYPFCSTNQDKIKIGHLCVREKIVQIFEKATEEKYQKVKWHGVITHLLRACEYSALRGSCVNKWEMQCNGPLDLLGGN